ncbi:unnamed protein product, partial [Brenthis ino]
MGATVIFLIATMASLAMGWDYTFPNYKRTPLGDTVDIASMKLLKEVYESADDKNVVASPLGVLTLLSLYASGAEGENRDEIMKFLGSSDYEQLSASYSQLSERFGRMDPSYLTLANKIFVSNQYTLNEKFSESARSYKSEVDSINFADTNSAANIINEWASRNTKGKINSPMSPSQIDPATAVALLNVIFFQGHWHVPFNASETKEQDFFTTVAKSVKKPMMHLVQSLYYHEDKDIGAKMIELPYKESQFRMIIVLPNEVDGLPEVVKKVAEKGLLEDVFGMYPAGADIDLDMPKFEIKSKHNLNDILPKVGVSSIFQKAANGIVKGGSVKVGSALQEAFVTVDEEGATAGAFTGLVAVPMSSWSKPPPPIPFKVDHPFLFAILHDDIILFTGTYSH